jgi:hypothetical protein
MLEPAAHDSPVTTRRLRNPNSNGDMCIDVKDEKVGFAECEEDDETQSFEVPAISKMFWDMMNADNDYTTTYAKSVGRLERGKFMEKIDVEGGDFEELGIGYVYWADCGVHESRSTSTGMPRSAAGMLTPEADNVVLRSIGFKVRNGQVSNSFKCDYALVEDDNTEHTIETMSDREHPLLGEYPHVKCEDDEGVLRTIMMGVDSKLWIEAIIDGTVTYEDFSDSDNQFFGVASWTMTGWWTCRKVYTQGLCTDMATEQHPIDPDYPLNGLNGLKVECAKGQALKKISWESSDSGDWVKADYTCCETAGVPFSIEPVAVRASAFDPREGIYCPVSSDNSGRSVYGKFRRFSSDASESGAIQYDRWTEQWCISSGDLGECVDYPTEWSDSVHKNCAWYAAGLCTKTGGYGSNWKSEYGTFDRYSKNGHTAVTACCACGGGRKVGMCFATHPAKRPTHASFMIKDGEGNDVPADLEIVEVTDFDGKYPVAVPEQPPGPFVKKEIPFPELLTFGATQPEYAVECKDDVIADPAKMAEVGREEPADAWAKNPCSQVAGEDGEWDEDWGFSYTAGPEGGGDGKQYGGIDYNTIMGCEGREAGRGQEQHKVDIAHTSVASTIGMTVGIADLIAAFIPDIVTFPMPVGAGPHIAVGQIVSQTASLVGMLASFTNDMTQHTATDTLTYEGDNDCNFIYVGFARVFCDMHCIRDAVIEGDKNLRSNLEAATKVTNTNMERLDEYYGAVVSEEIRELQYSVDEAAKSNEDAAAALVVKRGPEAMKTRIGNMLHEMRAMAASPMSTSGTESVYRAVDAFHDKAMNLAQLSEKPMLNASALSVLSEMEQHISDLHGHMTAASKPHVSKLATVANSVGQRAAQMQVMMQQNVARLGNWRRNAQGIRQRQNALAVERGQRKGGIVLMEFDKLWWDAHRRFDEYLDASDAESAAISSSLKALEQYRSCSRNYEDLSNSYRAAEYAQRKARDVLKLTWNHMVPKVGLISSSVVDGELFELLADEDSAMLNGTWWQAALLGNESRAQTSEEGGCPFDTPRGEKALLEALRSSMLHGAAGDAAKQLDMVFRTMQMLSKRQAATGKAFPQRDIDAVADARKRWDEAIRVAAESPALLQRLKQQLLPEVCGRASFLQMKDGSKHVEMSVNALGEQALQERADAVAAREKALLMREAVLEARERREEAREQAELEGTKLAKYKSTRRQEPKVYRPKKPIGQFLKHKPNAMLFEQCELAEHKRRRLTSDEPSDTSILAQTPAVTYMCLTISPAMESRCICEDQTMLLESAVNHKTHGPMIRQSCCPYDSIACGGCAVFQDGVCKECHGGFMKTEQGMCVACMDTIGWTDWKKRTCADYGRPAPSTAIAQGGPQCTSEFGFDKHIGLSAQDACCTCGGGHKTPTPFMYVVKPSVLGQPVSGFPFPRVATRYAVDADCPLVENGLTLDGKTGEISGTPHVQNAFSFTCTITAYQSLGIQPQKWHLPPRMPSATVTISVTAGFNYPRAAMFGAASTTLSPVTGNVAWPSVTCVDTDAGAKDSFGSGCAEYNVNPSMCGVKFDNANFQSQTVCCICGGGSRDTALAQYGMTCAPKLPWLTINAQTGVLTARNPSAADAEKVDASEVLGANITAINGGTCHISTSIEPAVSVGVNVVVAYPKYWDAIKYTPTDIVATLGVPILDVKAAPQEEVEGQLPPLVYSLSCGGAGNDFSYDVLSGVAYVAGKEAFLFDPLSGTVSGTPNIGLLKGLQIKESDNEGSPMLVRGELTLDCYAFGRAMGDGHYVSRGAFTLKLVDNTCWQEAPSDAFGSEASVLVEGANDEKACRDTCLGRPDCSHYRFKKTTAGSTTSAAASTIADGCYLWNLPADNQSAKLAYKLVCNNCGCPGDVDYDWKKIGNEATPELCYKAVLGNDWCGKQQFVFTTKKCYCRAPDSPCTRPKSGSLSVYSIQSTAGKATNLMQIPTSRGLRGLDAFDSFAEEEVQVLVESSQSPHRNRMKRKAGFVHENVKDAVDAFAERRQRLIGRGSHMDIPVNPADLNYEQLFERERTSLEDVVQERQLLDEAKGNHTMSMEMQQSRAGSKCPASGVVKPWDCHQGATTIGGAEYAADACAYNNLGIAWCSVCRVYNDWCGWRLCFSCGKTWLDILLHMIEVAKNIFYALKPVQDCLNALPEPQYHVNTMLKFLGDRIANPFVLVDDTIKVYISPAIEGALGWAQDKAGGGFEQVIVDKQAEEEAEMAVLEGGEDEANLNTVNNSANNTAQSNDWVAQIADSAMALLEDLASVDGLQIGKCLVGVVVKPAYQGAREEALHVIRVLTKPIIDVMAAMQKKMADWVATQLAKAAATDTWFGRLVVIGGDAAAAVCMEQMDATNVQLTKWRATMAQPMGNDNATAEYDAFKAYLDRPLDIAPVATKALQMVLVELEQWAMEKLISPALSFVIESLNYILGLILHAIDAIAGLALPVVGSFLAAMLTSSVQGAQNWISSTLYGEGMKFFKWLFSQMTAFVNKSMKLFIDNANVIGSELGVFAPIVPLIKQFMWQMLPDTNGKLAECEAFKNSLKDLLVLTKKNETTQAIATHASTVIEYGNSSVATNATQIQ